MRNFAANPTMAGVRNDFCAKEKATRQLHARTG